MEKKCPYCEKEEFANISAFKTHVISHPEAMEKLGIPINKKTEEEIEDIKKRLDFLESKQSKPVKYDIELPKPIMPRLPQPPIPQEYEDYKPREDKYMKNGDYENSLKQQSMIDNIKESIKNISFRWKVIIVIILVWLFLWKFIVPDGMPMWDWINSIW